MGQNPENNKQKKDTFELEIIVKSKRYLTESEIKAKNEENSDSTKAEDNQRREEEKSESTNFLNVHKPSVDSEDFVMQRGSKILDDFDEYSFDFEMESKNQSLID